MIFDMDKQKLIFNATVPFQEDFQLVSYHISDFSRSTSLNYLVRSWVSWFSAVAKAIAKYRYFSLLF